MSALPEVRGYARTEAPDGTVTYTLTGELVAREQIVDGAHFTRGETVLVVRALQIRAFILVSGASVYGFVFSADCAVAYLNDREFKYDHTTPKS